jgi:DNA-binding transcriptional ArsR family regulator
LSYEEDTYSSIFTALKHPIRRRILRMLGQSPVTYTDILNQLNIDNGLLNYHLDNIKELITKDKEGKYVLSEFGKAALSLTTKVEEPVAKQGDRIFGLNTIQIKSVLAILVIFLGVFTVLYVDLNNRYIDVETKYRSQLIPAWLWIGRFSITSHPETLIDVEQIDFERFPKLQEAFNVEEMSHALGYAHPYEWVNCTHSEGVEIVELFGGKYDPQLKYYNFNIRYKNQNYSIYTPFSWKPPLIS